MTDIPSLSLETLIRLSTIEHVIRPSVEPCQPREPDPDDDGLPKMICGTLFLNSGKMIDLDRLLEIRQRRIGDAAQSGAASACGYGSR